MLASTGYDAARQGTLVALQLPLGWCQPQAQRFGGLPRGPLFTAKNCGMGRLTWTVDDLGASAARAPRALNWLGKAAAPPRAKNCVMGLLTWTVRAMGLAHCRLALTASLLLTSIKSVK